MDSADTPPSSLPPAGLHDLAMELSMLSERRRDWRGLADILGFKYRQICVMEQQRSFEDPTWQARTVLQRWEEASQRRATATVRVLVYALTAVGLRSCLDILQEYLSGRLKWDTHRYVTGHVPCVLYCPVHCTDGGLLDNHHTHACAAEVL